MGEINIETTNVKGVTLDALLETVEKEQLDAIQDLLVYFPICKDTLYRNFITPDGKDRIKNGVRKNQVKGCMSLRRKWRASDNPTLQISYYKLAGDREDREKLQTSYSKTEHSGDVTHNIFIKEAIRKAGEVE